LVVPPQPPPHDTPVPPQVPQLAVRALPQLSVPLNVPQFLPLREQKPPSVSGVGVHTLLWQVLQLPEQEPQFAVRGLPQLSVPLNVPQFLP
jgi:hypothetical protein